MNKIIISLFLVVFSICKSQIHRFYYELNYKPSTKSPELKKDIFYLDTKDNTSVFVRKEKVESDSLFLVNPELTQSITPYGTMNFRILKDIKNKSVSFKDDLFIGILAYKENVEFPWKISQEKGSFEQYQTQKAEVNYGGRTWVAWFVPDIPQWDGPYVFMGLPGLIVDIKDSADEYHWKLLGSKKIPNADLSLKGSMDGEQQVSKEAYLKNKKMIMQDPMPIFMQAMMNIDKDSKVMMKMRQQADDYKKYFQKNDNSIEK
ncbi:GLPGLI family protein [Chryseobacterium sp. MYb264]|uniref:GLPGLI family protein n=1 Tax=Chryseobacterium sp. MYb264 TaxID=2745153 RepID=UPI002E11DFC7|nr:GLPGLI family protein [Chryseobacterium sp. MYb264]